MSGSVVVTGASTGIGRACVDVLVDRGFQVWAAVRKASDEAALRDAHPGAVRVLRLDLTDQASIAAAGEQVVAAGPLHGLVNNAGAALPGPLEYLPIEVFRRQLEVNLVGQLAVTQAMLPALRAAREAGGDPRIVMIGSIGGRIAGPMLGAYHASKFGLVGLTDSLRAELAPSGIQVVLIEPGAVKTPIWDRGTAAADDLFKAMPPEAGRYTRQAEASRAMAAQAAENGLPAERAARIVADALTDTHPRPRRLVGRVAIVAGTLVRLLPHRMIYRFTASRGHR